MAKITTAMPAICRLLATASVGLGLSIGPALSQTTSAGADAGARDIAAATSAAAADAMPADGPATLLIKKKKKKAMLIPVAPPAATLVPAVKVPASGSTGEAEQPPVPLNGAKSDAKLDTSVKDAAAPVSADATAAAPLAKKPAVAPAVVRVPANGADVATTATIVAPTKKPRKVAAAASPDTAHNCRVRSFLVNDFGKEGPTADAKRLLDLDIADWTAANGYKNVSVGPKTVSCVQFINLLVAQEFTCTASARVCWQ